MRAEPDGALVREELGRLFHPLRERAVEIPDACGPVDLTEQGLYFIGERL